jgi:RNA polymerase sigma-70 factor (ECF subfamily)
VDELAEWVGAAYPGAYRTAWLILHNPASAEEAVQEAFLRVWRFRDSIPPPPARTAWLYRVVVNACLTRLRAEARRPEQLGGVLPEPVDPQADPQAAAQNSALASSVLAALAGLPEPLRVPVVLRYYSGLSEREIATAIRRRPGTVKSRLAEARRRLADDPDLAAWAVVDPAVAR